MSTLTSMGLMRDIFEPILCLRACRESKLNYLLLNLFRLGSIILVEKATVLRKQCFEGSYEPFSVKNACKRYTMRHVGGLSFAYHGSNSLERMRVVSNLFLN